MSTRLFLAWVTTIDVPFDPAVHCDVQYDGFDLDLLEVEGEYASLKIVRTQTGWSFLLPSQPKCALVSWSPTGLAADAVVLARGRVSELPGNLLSSRQDILVTCAPRDIDARVLAFAKAKLMTAPEVDPLFSDWDAEAASSYLAGRSAVYHVDPVSHEVSLVDDLEGDRVIDLRGLGYAEGKGPSDGPGTDGPLVRTVRGKLSVAWAQSVEGSVDIALDVGTLGQIQTLDPSFADALSSRIQFEEAEGWSARPDGIRYESTKDLTAKFDTGTRYQVEITEPAVLQGRNWEAGTTYEERRLTAQMWVHTVKVSDLWMDYSWQQDREETVYASLDLPVLDTGVEIEGEDVIEMSLNDVFDDPVIAEYEIGASYKRYDTVRFNGYYYRCNGDHVATDFRQTRPVRNIVTGTGPAIRFMLQVSYWDEIPSPTGVRPRMDAFFETARGSACIQHLMMRLRKEGRRRLRARRIKLRYRWSDAVHVRRSDSVMIDVPWGDTMRAVTGKVLSLRKCWPERKAPFVEIEIAVSFGAGGVGLPYDGYAEDYHEPDYALVSSGHGDVSFKMDAPPVVRPFPTPTPANSVVQSRHGGEADEQIYAAMSIAARAGDVRECTVERPTWVTIRMRPLVPSGTITREIDVAGELAVGPAGVTIP